MKDRILLLSATLALMAAPMANRASAQTVAFDDAANYTTWTNGQNAGSGFLPWVLTATNASGVYGGRYIDTGSQAISSSTKTWGVYGNGPGTGGPFSMCYRGMSNALAANEVFKVKIENNGMNYAIAPYGYVGFCLRSDNNTNFADENIIVDPGTLFAFYNAGNVDDCYIYDGNGLNDSGITWAQLNAGLTLEFYLLSSDTYELIIKDATDSAVLASYPISPLASSGSIITFAGFEVNNSANQNVFFNDLDVAPASTVPPIIALTSPTNDEIYAAAPAQLSFDVTSMFSTISSNGVNLVLNGVNETNQMSFSGSGTANLQVTLNPPLQPNSVFNGTIIAVDANGNLATNTFTFNTWLPEYNNVYIEAADYNYSGGSFLDNALSVQLDNPEPPGSYLQPNQDYSAFDLLGLQGVDYSVETNIPGQTNAYRIGDLPGTEAATDVDHDNFAANGFQPYDLDYNEYGNWEDYTRELSNNVTYAVYARMAGFGANPTASFERMASPTVNSTNQPGAVLGTFVCPQTGGTQNYTFVPLTDFFSNPVLINFGGTNTFRITDIGGNGSYNVAYLLLQATTNTGTLRPYVTSGFPYPGAQGVNPENPVSFTIANDQTVVDADSIQFAINGSNVTSSLILSNNAAGTVVTYQPTYPYLLPPGTNIAAVIFSDGTVSKTNTWQFTVETLPTLPASWALPLTGNYARGFSEEIAKGDDSATDADFPPSVARAVAQLDGTLTNSATGAPYANEALNGGLYLETNTINYAVDSLFDGLFPPASPFPDIAPGETNNVAMAADMYALLSPGVYNFDVYSDDGFQFSAGATPATTNMILGIADYGRAATGTEFSFIVTNAGLYPMHLIYFKSQLGGGGVELYSIALDGTQALLNDSHAAGAVPVYYAAVSRPQLNISRSGDTVELQ
ncbi:MAG: hypothetical protein ACREE6_08730, partial [Limisphaerales bacterium]